MPSAIEVQTGKVVDFEIKVKCATNVVARVTLMANSQEFIDWMESHGPKCTANFDKSSKAMEV